MTHGPQTTPNAPNKGGLGLGVLGLLVSLFGVIVWLLPIDETGLRHILPFPFAVGGIVLCVLCLQTRGRGAAAAGIGLVLSGLALLFGLVMVTNDWLHFLH